MTVKIIGKFQEFNGEEFNAASDLIHDKALTYSKASDDGQVQLYYDDLGNTYVVAHDARQYYAMKERQGVPEPVVKPNSLLNAVASILAAGLLIYGINKWRDTRKHVRANIRA